jgi:predicted HicB family RNase H-like nuclease
LVHEQERAAFHQAHKDDSTVWGDAQERDPPRPRKNLDETITVRLSAEESEMLRSMAEAKGVSYSEIMRKAVKAYAGLGRPLEE